MSEQLTAQGEGTPVHKSNFDAAGDLSPVEVIVDALAAVEGVDRTNLPPLYDSIDPDALNKLFERRSRPDSSTLLCFTHHGWKVLVRGDGAVRVYDSEEETEPKSTFRIGT